MFIVVEFTKTCEVEAVPHTWMVRNTHCVWPPYKGTSRVNKAIINEEEPERFWAKYDARIMSEEDKSCKYVIGYMVNTWAIEFP